MKPIIPVLLASAFLIGGTYAQSPGAQTYANASNQAMTKSDGQRSMEIEKHIKDLHAKLKITPAEESQWGAVAQTMRDNAADLDRAIEKREAMGNTTAVEDLNAYGDIVQAHADAIKKLSVAFSKLYDSMPEAQKKVADEVFVQRVGKKTPIAMK